MLKAVIFDLDDTLLDWRGQSQDWIDYNRIHVQYVADFVQPIIGATSLDVEAFSQATNYFTHQAWQRARDTLEAPHLGLILYKAIQSLGVDLPQSITPDSLIDAYQWRGMPGVLPFDESADVLQTLKNYGLQIGLVTNAFQPMRLREYELREHGLLDYFDTMISAADAGVIKPNRAIFDLALKELNITPQEAVFVGDSREADILGAQNVGMVAILRRRVEDTALLHHKIKPDAEITHLEQLYEIFDERYPDWQNKV